jgi:hypothetical protein
MEDAVADPWLRSGDSREFALPTIYQPALQAGETLRT